MFMQTNKDSARKLSYAQAIHEGLFQAMEKDASVILIGEGVPDPKNIFSTTTGLQQQFGADRVLDMPISENGLTGVCIGAALSGMRPVMVHQRIDFALLAMDQLVNNAAKWHYMFDGQSAVPLVIRVIIGRGWGQGPQHSQSLQAMFAQVAGLKVVMPSIARDAKGMLLAAIADDNPVIFIEHRWLHCVEDIVPEDDQCGLLEGANVLHHGESVTVAAFSYMALESYAAAQALKSEMGIAIDILDMRSVRPLDIDAVIHSLSTTGRLIVADTASYTGSIAGEVIAQVTERAFDLLKEPPVRIGSPDYPVPTAPAMTDGYYPGAQTVADAVMDMLDLDKTSPAYMSLCSTLCRNTPHDTPNRDFSGPF